MDENNKKKRKINKKKKKRSEAWEKVMSSFTDDLWIEIFLRLPFKSLLRSKSVSKSWLSIISSHRFAKSYLDTGATNDDEILIVHHELGGDDEEQDGSFSLFHLRLGNIFKNLQFPYSQGEYPFEPVTSKLIGSDCGIVCVSVNLSSWRAAKNKSDIYLWNPATKHSKLIPPYTLPDEDCYWKSGSLGCGFDYIDLDFKVVRVVSRTLSAEVYSSNRNGWRKIESKPIATPYTSGFHVFHGFLFAIGYENDSMMAFNLNKEVFVCGIKLPVGNFDNYNSVIDITHFKDTVAVINSVVNEGKINLWTLDDETCVCTGVEASWKKVFSVDVGVPFESLDVLFSNSQFILFENDGDPFLYNSNTKVTSEVPINPFLERGEYFKYTKSLFSLVGFKRIKWAASSPRVQDSSDLDE